MLKLDFALGHERSVAGYGVRNGAETMLERCINYLIQPMIDHK